MSTGVWRALDERLIEKYGSRAFMYTEYPNLRFWSREYEGRHYREALKEFFVGDRESPLMFYVHIPHCHTQCLYCTCYVKITRDYDVVKRDVGFVFRELELWGDFFQEVGIRPNIREVHLGGGSPTYLERDEFDLLCDKLASFADLGRLDEFSIEIDPRHVRPDKLRYYREKGINRISFGVQDFELSVQKAVDRVQPEALVARLMTPELRSLFPNGINFDIICGLPNQTPETVRRTMEKVAAFSPDRVCLNYMDFKPEFYPHQRLMPDFPGNYERKKLFLTAMEVLDREGYLRIGYDHFAKPTDAVTSALNEGSMQWNRLGTTPGRYTSTLAAGVNGVTTLWPHYYFQHTYNFLKYEEDVRQGSFPVFRGHKMSRDDLVRRDVIHALRNYFSLDMKSIEEHYGLNFMEYFARELNALQEFQQDGVIEIREGKILISEVGHQFADAVCRQFDVYSDQRAAS